MKIPPISILSHTSESYANAISHKLGKGFQHAKLVYQEWFRRGNISGLNPAFKNAQALLQNILSLTDFSFLPISQNLTDGQTGKFLIKTIDDLDIESVLIPMQAGGTLCISSQIGCQMGCAFCETGRMGLLRNLTTQEILSQLFIAKFRLHFSVRNIVFMGMGEPFDNYDTVMHAFRILTDSHGFGLGNNRITISTSGCLEGIYRLLQETTPLPNLAVSLNAPNDELRNKLMPINKKYPLKELYQAIYDFCKQTSKQVLIAYVLIKEQNDSIEHAKQLTNFLSGLNVKINLIPYNPQSRDRFQSPEQSTLENFTSYLREKGFYTLLRQTKGQKIMAACGQLGNLELKRKKPFILPILKQ
ncbi:23S rRNA (adenine(2503)-C(2))-methyltransferase RlmN [Candidatus Protochlamydia sp. W-9]|uniref:23S rRNA (adenine(2503)-C(2))-methyltransferase RlmN n=1 Tax=Candidatus Protochlamydia sp. W-9 TaxID=1785087 RepID=UPI00096AC7C4|nr:23S rRNA (adenine(2503)-C(2))-methyltransferase RlmN [Candidatus Protochlamydia sp. W-9]